MLIVARSARKSSRQAVTQPTAACAEARMATQKLFCRAWSLTRSPPRRPTLYERP